MEHKDCFAWCGGSCSALKECICKEKNNCPFYKTRFEIEVEYIMAVKRKKRLGLNIDLVNINNN